LASTGNIFTAQRCTGVINDNAAFLHYFFNVTKTQRVCHVPSHTKHHDFQRIMQSFKNLAEGTFDEAFAKIVHTKLYQIRLLRHNHTLRQRLLLWRRHIDQGFPDPTKAPR
jgi:hypothetical protein